MQLENIFWPGDSGESLPLPMTCRRTDSLVRVMPMRLAQVVICLSATAFTPLLIPAKPSRLYSSCAILNVDCR